MTPRAPPAASLARAAGLGGHLPPLLVAAERVAATVAQGVHGRRRPGQGDSFWQFRPLLPGEGVARVDWRQSARAGRAFIRQTEWEAAQTVALWHGAGPGMDWSSDPARPTKLARAQLLLLALAALLVRGGEQVRLIGEPGRSCRGRAGLERLAASLDGAPRPPDPAGLPRHSHAVLLGDFFDDPAELRALLAGYAAVPMRGVLLQILDPAETELPYVGRVRFEGGRHGALIGQVQGVRARYRQRLATHQAELHALCSAAGFLLLSHRTDAPPENALMTLYAALAPHAAT